VIDGQAVSEFDRNVVCIGGLPFDVVGMPAAVDRIYSVVAARKSFFLSTPNLNFLMTAMQDASFRDSVIHSELSVVDGMPLVWMARLLGFPITERVAGASLFNTLWHGGASAKDKPTISVYFFGGPPGVAELAGRMIDSSTGNMRCAGYFCPGFGSIEEMSSPAIIDAINASGADFLVVSLGAKKGQAWIELNRDRITVPVLSHLGAVVNFVAGTVNRAPVFWQNNGLEWLWRIKEERSLLTRYLGDGLGMLRFLFQRVIPYAIWLRTAYRLKACDGTVRLVQEGDVVRFELSGDLGCTGMAQWREQLKSMNPCSRVVLDFKQVGSLPPEFFSLLLLLKKKLDAVGVGLSFVGISSSIHRHFYWNGLDFLVKDN